MLDTTFTFIGEVGAFHAFTSVGPSKYLRLISPKEDKRICNKYNGCVVPLNECLFSLIGLCLPFKKIEIGVLNNLLIAPLELYLVSQAYVKVF